MILSQRTLSCRRWLKERDESHGHNGCLLYTSISQGKVEAIFNSKPEDRRGIFEEAAGVLKYKQRKKKAEQKLFETEDNLSRVQDIIYELEDQLVPLAAQADAAKKYLALKEELTEIDVNLTVTEIQEAKAIWETKTQELTAIEEKLASASKQVHDLEGKLVRLRSKRNRLDEQIETEQQQLLQVTEALKQAEGQKNVLIERSKHLSLIHIWDSQPRACRETVSSWIVWRHAPTGDYCHCNRV